MCLSLKAVNDAPCSRSNQIDLGPRRSGGQWSFRLLKAIAIEVKSADASGQNVLSLRERGSYALIVE